jgi:hypothetical protein
MSEIAQSAAPSAAPGPKPSEGSSKAPGAEPEVDDGKPRDEDPRTGEGEAPPQPSIDPPDKDPPGRHWS